MKGAVAVKKTKEKKKGNRKTIIIVVAVVLILCVLFPQSADKAELNSLISSSIESAEQYTPVTYDGYIEALEEAKDVCDKRSASQEDVDNATVKLKNAIDGLMLRADKTDLIDAYNNATSIDVSKYMLVTVDELNHALDNAKSIMENENATSSEVEVCLIDLQKAIDGLSEKPDKTELVEEYRQALLLDVTQYLSSTVTAFSDAIDAAKMVIDNEGATTKEVDEALISLREAKDGLSLKPDKTAFKALVDNAEGYSDEKYTTASYNVLQTALDTVRNVLEDEQATQNEVDQATSVLQEAVDGMVKSTKCVWNVSVRLTMLDNEGIGHEWTSSITYGGEEVYGNFEVVAAEGSNITIKGSATEEDKKPDRGSGSVSLKLTDGNSNATTFNVKENAGRNAGKKAVWELEVSCVFVERV